MYAERLKKLFKGIELHVNDMLLLDTFQIGTLSTYVPEKELAAVLHEYKYIEYFLKTKCPEITEFLSEIMRKHRPVKDSDGLNKSVDKLVWELAFMIISNKYPEVCDSRASIQWSIEELDTITELNDKIILDVGAGTGKLAFLLSTVAKTVFAVEPVTNLRGFIRKKIEEKHITNLYVTDGFLNRIPLPDKSVNILITSNAIGWDFDREFSEIERVTIPGGYAIHLLQGPKEDELIPYHRKLTSGEWKYEFSKSAAGDNSIKVKYWKRI